MKNSFSNLNHSFLLTHIREMDDVYIKITKIIHEIRLVIHQICEEPG
ncbi:hypothetical protein LINPERPRIM_LOCUS14178 [Linum perenne]